MNQINPRVDIVICSYKNKELTAKCLDSLLDSTYINYNIILVDDHSPDDSVDYFQRHYPEITVIANEVNLGPAASRNRGINHGQAEYIVTMDNDATLSKTWLTEMIRLMDSDESIGQAVGKILFAGEPGKIAAAGGSMLFRGKGYDIGLGAEADNPRYNQFRQVLYACSASMIIRRSVLEKIGGFYEGYYHGYEDTDLSLRANIAGFKVVYQPNSISYHGLSATVNKTIDNKRTTYLWMRNRLLIMLRNYPWPFLIKFFPLNIRFNIGHCLSEPDDFLPFIRSIISIIINAFNIHSARKENKRLKKISDERLEQLFNLN
ncbi:MAG: glycosyltransferase family 2 protein [Candidatus Buchananbacteria bacterium]